MAEPSTRSVPLVRRWPATTVTMALSLGTLAVLVGVTMSAEPEQDIARAEAPAASEVSPESSTVAPPVALEPLAVETPEVTEVVDHAGDRAARGSRGKKHRGEEGAMGGPSPGAVAGKAGLYAMAGPGAPAKERKARSAGVLGARAPDDIADLKSAFGSEPGDAGGSGGSGGLGLIGTGRGGGGVSGHGYGRGSGAGFGGRGSRDKYRWTDEVSAGERDEAGGYDRSLQARRLTAGVIDDASDPQRYADYLKDMQAIRDRLRLGPSWGTVAGPGPGERHAARPELLEVALVIDTTGSMSDELEYLKVELKAIAEEIHAAFPDVAQRYAMVAYRDHGDAYLTRTTAFSSVDGFVSALGRQRASGGGDFPEAMDAALEQANALGWTDDARVARMTFVVADAPPHDERMQSFTAAVEDARARGIALYPVAASGAADTAEYLMRTAAHVTGGQYLFLTDHSGVGSPHAKPHVDKYDVETLHDAMRRMIERELSAPVVETPPPVLTKAVAVAPEVSTPPTVTPPECGSFWDRLRDALAQHFGFASGMTLAVLLAMGIDARRRRRRR